MGAPSITISFIEKAMTAVTRGERGIVMLWVKDTLAAPAVNPVTVVTEKDIPDSLKDATVEQIKLAMIGYTNAPKKVIVYCMGIADDAEKRRSTWAIKRLWKHRKQSNLIIWLFRQLKPIRRYRKLQHGLKPCATLRKEDQSGITKYGGR